MDMKDQGSDIDQKEEGGAPDWSKSMRKGREERRGKS